MTLVSTAADADADAAVCVRVRFLVGKACTEDDTSVSVLLLMQLRWVMLSAACEVCSARTSVSCTSVHVFFTAACICCC